MIDLSPLKKGKAEINSEKTNKRELVNLKREYNPDKIYRITNPNGDIYTGKLKDGQPFGPGKLEFFDGDFYEGQI